jgi:exodeoxyribonuclease VII small subunit
VSTPPGQSTDAELSYEQARDELARVVQRLESGGVPLDESLALWERGEQLATICQRWLDGAKSKIEAARNQTPRDPEPRPRGG